MTTTNPIGRTFFCLISISGIVKAKKGASIRLIGGGGEPVPIIVLQFCVRFMAGCIRWGLQVPINRRRGHNCNRCAPQIVDPAATMTPEKEADLWAIEISPYGNCDFHAFVLIFSSGVEPSEKVIQRVFLRFTYTDTHSQSAFDNKS